MRVLASIGLVAIMCLLVATPANAYIDPQSGSYALQILIAGLAAGGLAIATFWRRIFSFIRRIFGRAGESSASSSPSRAVVIPEVEHSGPSSDSTPLEGSPAATPTDPSLKNDVPGELDDE